MAERFQDLYSLLNTDGEVLHDGVRIDFEIELFGHPSNVVSRLFVIDPVE